MPIRPELRYLYRTPEYREARSRIVIRSGDRCEQCRKPNHVRVETVSGKQEGDVFMFWRGVSGWNDLHGEPVVWRVKKGMKIRSVYAVLGMAHLDHDPANNRDSNVKFMCQWCHLNHDKPHHAETRAVRKDSNRPLLAVRKEDSSEVIDTRANRVFLRATDGVGHDTDFGGGEGSCPCPTAQRTRRSE